MTGILGVLLGIFSGSSTPPTTGGFVLREDASFVLREDNSKVVREGAGTPVVTGGTVNFGLPAEPNQLISTLSATNSPTSWAITAGNSAGNFALDNSGNLTITTTGAPSTTLSDGYTTTNYPLTVTATNGNGTSSPATVTVSCQSLPWPDASNRPSVSGSTLTCTRPTNGGPSTLTDGSLGTTLTAHAGDLTSSSNNQVIEAQDVSGNIVINHTNVTVRRCRSQFIFLGSANTPALIEDCTFQVCDCLASFMTGVTFRRCSLHDNQNMITKNVVNTFVKDCYFFNDSGSSDGDYFETNAGSTGNRVTNCSFGPKLDGFLNAAVNGTNLVQIGAPGVDVSFIMDRNRCFNMTDHVPINDDDNQGSGTVTGSYINNMFFNCAGSGGPAGQFYRLGRSTTLVNVGNVVGSSATSLGGTLVNGTGQL